MAEQVVYEIVVDSDKAKEGLNEVTKETGKLKKGVKETGDATSGLTGKLDSMTGGAVTGMKSALGATKKLILGMKTLKGAVMATGIGALVVVIGALVQSFKSSEEGQNRWAKLMGVIGAVTSVFTDKLATLGTFLIDTFTNPKQAIKDFAGLIKSQIVNRFEGLINLIPSIGTAIKQLFSGDISGAFKTATDSVGKVVLGVDNLTDKATNAAGAVKKLVNEISEEAKIADQIAVMRAKADKIERGLIVERAKANQKRADLLNKAMDKERFTASERKAFLLEAGKIDEDITKKEMDAVALRIKAKKAENALGLSTKEDKEELARLEAKLIELDTARLSKAKEVTSQIVALTAEERAEKKRLNDEAIANQKKIDDFNANTKEEKRQVEKDKLKTQFDELMKLAKDDKEAQEELKKSYDQRSKELTDKFNKEDSDAKEKKRKDDEAKRKEAFDKQMETLNEENEAIMENDETNFSQKKDALAIQRQAILDDETLSEEERTKMLDANSQARIKIASTEEQQRIKGIQAVGAAMQAFSGLAGKETAAGKALGVAGALINTYLGATQVLKDETLPTYGKIAGVAAVLASGFASVKSIMQVKVPGGGGSAGASAPQKPSFNLVGQSQGNVNSQTEAAAQQSEAANNTPTRAYVVSTDITSQQALDRATESQGELG